jgi:hypothetical protein
MPEMDNDLSCNTVGRMIGKQPSGAGSGGSPPSILRTGYQLLFHIFRVTQFKGLGARYDFGNEVEVDPFPAVGSFESACGHNTIQHYVSRMIVLVAFEVCPNLRDVLYFVPVARCWSQRTSGLFGDWGYIELPR